METLVSDAPVLLTGHALIDTMDKDALEEYARETFNRELDKRRKLPALRDEVKALFDGTTQRAEAAAVVAAVDALRPRTPTRCRHRVLCDENGNPFEFEWNPLFEGNADLEVIEWE